MDASLLSPVATLVVGTIGTLMVWAKDIRGASSRIRAIDESIKRIQFWSDFREAGKNLDSINIDSELIEEEFAFAAATVKNTRLNQLPNRDRVSRTRRFFLLYRMSDAEAKTQRLIGYLLLFNPLLSFFGSHSVRYFWALTGHVLPPQNVSSTVMKVSVFIGNYVFAFFMLRHSDRNEVKAIDTSKGGHLRGHKAPGA